MVMAATVVGVVGAAAMDHEELRLKLLRSKTSHMRLATHSHKALGRMATSP